MKSIIALALLGKIKALESLEENTSGAERSVWGPTPATYTEEK